MTHAGLIQRAGAAMLLSTALLCAAQPPTSVPATAPSASQPAGGDEQFAAKRQGDPFYVTWCATCAKPRYRTGQSILFMHGDRELRFCCKECVETFDSDPAAAITALDRRLIEDQLPHYPLTSSIVSDKPLGEHPVEVIWNNRLFRLADEAERATLMNDPMRFQRLLDDEVIKAQDPIYGPSKCPVQGEFFDESEIRRIVIGNRMIKLCCGNCVRVVRANPGQYLVMVDSSNREAARNRAAAAAASRPAKP